MVSDVCVSRWPSAECLVVVSGVPSSVSSTAWNVAAQRKREWRALESRAGGFVDAAAVRAHFAAVSVLWGSGGAAA
eukprot:11439854-Alexandrium_andersonii.AAC.1